LREPHRPQSRRTTGHHVLPCDLAKDCGERIDNHLGTVMADSFKRVWRFVSKRNLRDRQLSSIIHALDDCCHRWTRQHFKFRKCMLLSLFVLRRVPRSCLCPNCVFTRVTVA
jgi:hypothetical protein